MQHLRGYLSSTDIGYLQSILDKAKRWILSICSDVNIVDLFDKICKLLFKISFML